MGYRIATIATGLLLARWLPVSAQEPVLTGRTIDDHGRPIAGVSIEVPPGTARARSDSAGRFAIRGLRGDTVRVRARRLGYVPLDTALPTASESTELQLHATALHLQAVEVRERVDPSAARLAGFRERATVRSQGGRFITRAQLDARISMRMVDVLREVPGVTVRGPTRYADRSIRLRGANCPPLVFVDGAPASAGEFELDLLDPAALEGIEIYPGLASVPAPFQAARALHRCGVIAVWSRPPRERAAVRQGEHAQRVASLVARGAVYAASEVDEKATMIIENSAEPIYPESLWVRGVGGDVIIEAIVDTTGRVELESVSVVSATDPRFGAAAAIALAESVFTPAARNRRRVRQVVHVPYAFVPPAGWMTRAPQEIP